MGMIAEKTDMQSAKTDTENGFEILPYVGTRLPTKRHLLYFKEVLTGS